MIMLKRELSNKCYATRIPKSNKVRHFNILTLILTSVWYPTPIPYLTLLLANFTFFLAKVAQPRVLIWQKENIINKNEIRSREFHKLLLFKIDLLTIHCLSAFIVGRGNSAQRLLDEKVYCFPTCQPLLTSLVGNSSLDLHRHKLNSWALTLLTEIPTDL